VELQSRALAPRSAESLFLTQVCEGPDPGLARWESRTFYPAAGKLAHVGDNRDGVEPSVVDPLYLFGCGVQWHRGKEPVAGWELIRALRSHDGEERSLAADLLAKTEHSRLLVRDLRRAKARLNREISNRLLSPESKRPAGVSEMNTPYGLNIIDSCVTCGLRKNQWFCGLSPDAVKVLADVSHPAIYPASALLFVEGQTPRGAYMLCSGKAKLSTTSRDGKVLILKIAGEGEVLGLSAAISGQPFEVTAETTSPCQINFIERDGLIRGIETNGELGLRSSLALSREFQSAFRDIHDLILARSSAGKLAKLLVSWMPHRGKIPEPGEVRIRASLTHEEMAQMIGSSRETVTRLLGDLKRKDLIRLEGATMVIRDRSALEALAA